jgi:hypothetical protein
MPKRILLLLVLLLPLVLHAQIGYHRYLDSTSVWFEWAKGAVFAGPNCPLGGENTTFYRYHIVGWDSLDGQAWYLVHQDWTSTQVCFGQPTQYGAGQSVLPSTFRIREDSTGKIWRKDGAFAPVLRYDFQPGLAVADTLWMEDRLMPCAIAAIDTVYLGTDARKRYWCACSQPSHLQYVIEGIGYNQGLDVTWAMCSQVLDIEFKMICYHQGGDILLLDSLLTCGIPLHNPTVGIVVPDLSGASVDWQESGERLVVRLPAGTVEFDWVLYDPSGRRIRAGVDVAGPLELPGLAQGMYIFVGQTSGGRFIRRFVH